MTLTTATPGDGVGLRPRIGLWLGPAVALALLVAPLPLEAPAQRLAAVGALVVVYWVSEALPLPVTALLGPALAAALGVATPREVFAPFGDPVILLFLGSFLLAEALHVHGLDRRLALLILALPGVARSPWRVLAAVAAVTAALSMWISNTATAAMMLPIVMGLLRSAGAGGNQPTLMLLTLGYAASIGGVATPVGTPPNLIAMGFIERMGGRALDFPTFMALGLPLSATLLLVTGVVLRLLHPGGAARLPDASGLRAERRALPAWGAGQWACAVVFALVVTFWIVPGTAGLFLARDSALLGALDNLHESVVALAGAALLFAWPVGSRRALGWEDAARVDWGTLLLFGGGLSMGKLFFDTGLAVVLGRAGVDATGVSSLWGLTALALASALLLTELTSNTAAVNMLAPLVAALAQEMGVPVIPPILALAFGASMAFMLPISTPPNAIIYGSGLVPLPAMMRAGAVLNVLSFVFIFAWLRLLCPLLGLA